MAARLVRYSGRNKGAFSLEYAVLIAVVAAGLIGMSIYIKRALCGRWREGGDTFGYGRQYQPGLTITTEK